MKTTFDMLQAACAAFKMTESPIEALEKAVNAALDAAPPMNKRADSERSIEDLAGEALYRLCHGAGQPLWADWNECLSKQAFRRTAYTALALRPIKREAKP